MADEQLCCERLAKLDRSPPDELLPAGDTKNFWAVEYDLTRTFPRQDSFSLRTLAGRA